MDRTFYAQTWRQYSPPRVVVELTAFPVCSKQRGVIKEWNMADQRRIRIDADAAERLIARCLREDHLLPEVANNSARRITTALLAATKSTDYPSMTGARILPGSPPIELVESIAQTILPAVKEYIQNLPVEEREGDLDRSLRAFANTQLAQRIYEKLFSRAKSLPEDLF